MYPGLAPVARTFLATMATEASCERSPHRQNLDASMLDMLVHIKVNMNKLLVEDPADPKHGQIANIQRKRLDEYVKHRDEEIQKDGEKEAQIPANTSFWMDS